MSMNAILDSIPKNSKIYNTLRKKVDNKNSNQQVYPVTNDTNNNTNNTVSTVITSPNVPKVHKVNCPPSKLRQPTPVKKERLVNNSMTQDEINNAFTEACEWGYFPKARRIWKEAKEINKQPDLHFDTDRAFRHSCYYGFLGIAKWLYKLSNEIGNPIDVTDNEHYAFQWACTNEQYHVAQWLASLCPEYKINFTWSIDNYTATI